MTSNPLKFGLTVSWIVTSALQYGYHIAALNSSAQSIVCNAAVAPAHSGAIGLPSCVEMSDAQFGTVTSAYTLGGLVGSLGAGSMLERWGKKGTAVRSALVIMLGASAVSFGSSLLVLVLGRILIGVSCGIATVLVPLYLSSVAPPSIAGNIGILTQISINVGIFAAQGFSIPLSTPGTGRWRFVSLISIAVAAAQILTSPLVPDSRVKDPSDVRPFDAAEDEERTPLAGDDAVSDRRRKSDDPERSLSVMEVLRSSDPAVRKALWTLVTVMLFQQFSGINAVMYYSTSILTAVNPASAKMVSLYVTLVNLIMTFPAIFLIDRLGRRSLLLLSLASMSVSTAILGWSINTQHFLVASAGIIAFVVSFAIGLGPVPFVLVGEMPPKEASSVTASIAVAVNWTSNLIVGVGFLPLRDWLAGDNGRSGSVFFLFTALTALGTVVVARMRGGALVRSRRRARRTAGGSRCSRIAFFHSIGIYTSLAQDAPAIPLTLGSVLLVNIFDPVAIDEEFEDEAGREWNRGASQSPFTLCTVGTLARLQAMFGPTPPGMHDMTHIAGYAELSPAGQSAWNRVVARERAAEARLRGIEHTRHQLTQHADPGLADVFASMLERRDPRFAYGSVDFDPARAILPAKDRSLTLLKLKQYGLRAGVPQALVDAI